MFFFLHQKMSGKMIKLQAGDETIVEVPRETADLCITVANQLKDLGDDVDFLHLPNVNGPVLQKVVEFATHYKDHPDEIGEIMSAAGNPEDENKPRKPKKIPPLTE